ncbi:hypothetical protein DFH07DRAFT_962326 [Mycena maculata]|uniref:Uncharacterized protein n=1 Tax=Mycena maculata TaxID=230809 RepID=A0AAD7IQ84_9AGAR|nr:hypothetical protein DFH07DRAFT_962326 [Mycena maculata]
MSIHSQTLILIALPSSYHQLPLRFLSQMPRGRPRLDPEIKEQSLQESRKRYEESKFKPLRNREKRREEAKLRMQRKRAAIAASDWRTKREYHDNAAANSARYRDRKFAQEREERSVANAVKKRARKCEEQDLRRKHKPTAKPLPIPRAKLPLLPAKLPHRHLPSSPITPTPAPRRKGRLAAEDLNNSAVEEEPDEGRAHHPIEAPMWPMRAPQPKRCPYCFEEYCIGPPSSPSTLSASTLSHAPSPPCSRPVPPAKALSLREQQIQRNAEHYKFLAAEDARIAAVDQKLSKEELTYLASSRPPPVPISPERMRQQFARILGGCGAPPSILRSKSPESSMLSPEEARIAQTTFYQDAAHQRPCQVPRPEVPINNSHGEGVESHWGDAPVMYAVSGKNRVFQDRGRAMAAFKGTPGADLVFTRNEDELFRFLAENVEGKMTI